jgi:hypothetical protein
MMASRGTWPSLLAFVLMDITPEVHRDGKIGGEGKMRPVRSPVYCFCGKKKAY